MIVEAVETSKPSVQITLTPKEADILVSILGFIGGSPKNSPRGFFDSLHTALQGFGYGYYNSSVEGLIEGGIYFAEYT